MDGEQIGGQIPYTERTLTAFKRIACDNRFLLLEEITRLSKGEFFVLGELLARREPTSPTVLSRSMQSSKGRISAILNVLEKKGEIERRIDPQNRRTVLVTLTESGKAHAREVIAEHDARLTAAFSRMGERDAQECVRLMGKMMDAMHGAIEEEKALKKEHEA